MTDDPTVPLDEVEPPAALDLVIGAVLSAAAVDAAGATLAEDDPAFVDDPPPHPAKVVAIAPTAAMPAEPRRNCLRSTRTSVISTALPSRNEAIDRANTIAKGLA